MQGKRANRIDYTARARGRRVNAEKETKKLFDSGDGDDENWQCINRKLTGRQANTPLGSIPMDAVQLKAQGTTKFKS